MFKSSYCMGMHSTVPIKIIWITENAILQMELICQEELCVMFVASIVSFRDRTWYIGLGIGNIVYFILFNQLVFQIKLNINGKNFKC